MPAMTIRLPATVTFAGCLLLAAATGLPAALTPYAVYGARLPLALAFALFTPGYLLVCTVFPGEEQLGHLARLAMSLAASLPLIIALTILQHFTPFDRSASAQLLTTDALVLVLAIAATLRQRRTAGACLTYVLSSGGRTPWRDPYVLIALVLVVVLAGEALNAGLGARSEPTTSLSLAMGDSALNPVQADHVILDVHSREHFASTFQIAVTWQGHPIGQSALFSLQPSQRRREYITTTPPPGHGPVPVDVWLFRDHASVPYRQLHIWMRTIPYRIPL